MIKIKQFNLFIALILPLLAISIVFAGSSSNYASAADPGCYANSASVGSDNTVTRNTTSTNCPDSTTQDQVDDNNKCFVTTVGSSGQSAFNETNCDDIVTGNSNIGEATRPSPSEDTAASSSGSGTNNGSTGFGCTGGSNAEECRAISPGGTVNSSDGSDGKQCGKQADDGSGSEVILSINVGCRGESWPKPLNPIIDMAFAFIRFLSAGVGLVVIGSIIWAGIQYSVSRGNPQSTEAAISRITNTFFALLLYIFIFAVANFLVPGGMFL